MKKIGETSYKETAFGIIPRSKLIIFEIEGIKKAWDFILDIKNKKDKIPITVEFIKKTHLKGFGWIFPQFGGEFRKVDVQVSGHIPPKFYLIPQLMSDYIEDLKERTRYLPDLNNDHFLEELISLLAFAHHRFLWIHPFQDYNGRVGRLLINIILLNLDFPPIELKIETKSGRKRYIEALKFADNNDYSKLEKIIKIAIYEAVKEIEK